MSSNDITDPEFYSLRDVLLLSQLLHTNHIGTLETLKSSNEDKLYDIIQKFTSHKSFKLENKVVKLSTIEQLVELYSNLFKYYDVDTTADLANYVYYKRIEELENIIEDKKSEFQQVLNE
ncbi:unnamed protein product [Candida verbasci]|uniref:Uncharacterized protein n=1 Tax=Candida verbasci TaxID=1227364 RepID=A0A9W4TUW2_9ASCO|nr:unnamed protein product [Candida verbasci]